MSMSSESDQDTVQPAVPAPISADSFAGVRDVISLVVSERACNARLRQLKQAQADAERALAELVGVRTENAAVVRKERAEIETARAAVEKREPAIFVREEEIKAAAEEHRQTRAELDRLRGRFQTVGPGGLVREFVPGHPRGGEDSPRRRTKGVNRT